MGGLSLFDPLLRRLRQSRRQKRQELARSWPTVDARVSQWHIVPADPDLATSSLPYQIEASFSFIFNGEYFGGYLRSAVMTHHQAETSAIGEASISIKVRYDSKDPDRSVALAEDNQGNLPFEIASG